MAYNLTCLKGLRVIGGTKYSPPNTPSLFFRYALKILILEIF